MISINLLPVKQIRARLKARNDIISLAILLAAVLVVLGGVGAVRSSQISSQKDHISTLTRKRASYQATLNEIEKLKNDKKSLETKLAVIGKLKKDSQFAVRFLDELANVTPQGRVRLNSMTQSSGKLTMSGVAEDDASIALYMEQLEGSPYFANPELGGSSLQSEDAKTVRAFSLACDITVPGQEKEAEKKQ